MAGSNLRREGPLRCPVFTGALFRNTDNMEVDPVDHINPSTASLRRIIRRLTDMNLYALPDVIRAAVHIPPVWEVSDKTHLPANPLENNTGSHDTFKVTVPWGTVVLTAGAFKETPKLTDVKLTPGLRTIGDEAFMGCSDLREINFPDTLTEIGENAFSYTGLTTLTLPPKLDNIKDWTFAGCHGLTRITLPNNVASIGEAAFRGSINLTHITRVQPSAT